MKIGVISLHPDRLLWYSSSFPEHCFIYCAPESLAPDLCACENYIVDADLLTDDRASYGVLARYLNRHVMDKLMASTQNPCLPQNGKGRCRVAECPQGNIKPHGMVDERVSSGTRFHTIIHRESKSS
jgi:hypothetical protein